MYFMKHAPAPRVPGYDYIERFDAHVEARLDHLIETDHYAHVEHLYQLRTGGDVSLGGLTIYELTHETGNDLRLFYEDGLFILAEVATYGDYYQVVNEWLRTADIQQVIDMCYAKLFHFAAGDEAYIFSSLPIEALALYEPFSMIGDKRLTISWYERDMCLEVIDCAIMVAEQDFPSMDHDPGFAAWNKVYDAPWKREDYDPRIQQDFESDLPF